MIIMAAAKSQIENDFKQGIINNIHKEMKMDFSRGITEHNFSREGINAESLSDAQAEFIKTQLNDMMLRQDVNLPSSANFFPIQLDPNVYNEKILFMRTPLLTYLESLGVRKPVSTTKFNYIELTEGFQEEWIGETDATEGTGTNAATNLGTAQICFEAVPFNLSDLLGAGQTVTTRAQLMNMILQTLREGYEKVLLNGSGGSGSPSTNQFDGLYTIAGNSGYSTSNGGDAMTLNAMRILHANLRQRQKGMATFILTDEFTHTNIQDEMAATIRNINTTNEIVAGVNPTAYQASAAEIPIIVSPFSPMTVPSPDDGSIPTNRNLGMFNEQFVNVQDLITSSWVEAGKTRPLATNGWIMQASVMFYTVPPQSAVITDIAE
jgi:hypothetical protein